MASYAYRFPRKYRYRPHGRSNAGPAAVAAIAAALVAASGTAKIAHHAAALPAGGGAAAAQAISYARAQLGRPYLWGGTGPDAFDCSGLVMEAYLAAGIHLARTSEEQWATETHIPASQVQAGDLVFFAGMDGTAASPGHVGIVVDPGRDLMIDAYGTGTPVGYATYGADASLGGLSQVVGFTDPQGGA